MIMMMMMMLCACLRCMFSVELWKNAFVLLTQLHLETTVRYVRLRPLSIVRAGARDTIQRVNFCSSNIGMLPWTPVVGDHPAQTVVIGENVVLRRNATRTKAVFSLIAQITFAFTRSCLRLEQNAEESSSSAIGLTWL